MKKSTGKDTPKLPASSRMQMPSAEKPKVPSDKIFGNKN
jgi:hypothetical protein